MMQESVGQDGQVTVQAGSTDSGGQNDGTTKNIDPDSSRLESVYSQHSVRTQTSQTALKPEVYVDSDKFFSHKPAPVSADGKCINRMEIAVGVCQRHCADANLGTELQGSWLLTEIDHWNCEHERIVLLTEKALISVNFHFIMNKVQSYRHVMLDMVDTIAIGDFQYPGLSVMPARRHGGVQVRWNKGAKPSFSQRWNPFCKDIPYATLSHHPMFYNPSEKENVTYSVDNFFEAIVRVTNKAHSQAHPGQTVTVEKEPIVISSYASVGSLVFNQSSLGFFMDRNGVCY